MTDRIEDALADCLESFLKGQANLEACLERYPKYKDELSKLLEVASRLPHLSQDVEPELEWRERTKAALLAKISGAQGRGKSTQQ